MSEKQFNFTDIGQAITSNETLSSLCKIRSAFDFYESFIMLYTNDLCECDDYHKTEYLAAAERIGAWG